MHAQCFHETGKYTELPCHELKHSWAQTLTEREKQVHGACDYYLVKREMHWFVAKERNAVRSNSHNVQNILCCCVVNCGKTEKTK